MIEKGKIVKGSDKGAPCRVVCLDSEACKNCSGSMFCKIEDKSYEADNATGTSLEPGDNVEVYFPTGQTVFISFLVLIFPLFCFLFVFLLLQRLGVVSEVFRVLGGSAGLLAGLAISGLILKRPRFRRRPQVTRILLRKEN